jgi:hypothetical protein
MYICINNKVFSPSTPHLTLSDQLFPLSKWFPDPPLFLVPTSPLPASPLPGCPQTRSPPDFWPLHTTTTCRTVALTASPPAFPHLNLSLSPKPNKLPSCPSKKKNHKKTFYGHPFFYFSKIL